VAADEGYIRESILQPKAKIVAGYQPIMPTFQGLVTEEQILSPDGLYQVSAVAACAAKGRGNCAVVSGEEIV